MRPTLLVLASTYPRWENDPEPGFVHELCRRLARSFDVIAVVPDAPEAAPSGMLDGVEVLRYRYAPRKLQTLVNNGGIACNLKRSPWKWLLVPGFIVGQYFAARRVVRARHVDAVHAHWLIPQGWIARILLRRKGAPFVVTSHGGDLFGFRGNALQAIKRKVAQASATMTVVSSAMRDEVARLGLHPSRLVVLPMGVDLQHRFVADGDTKRHRQQLLFVGRLVPKKGLPYLLHAVPKVLVTRPGVTLKIVGFGPERPALMALAAQLGRTPASWAIATRLIAGGSAGIIVPSYASEAASDHRNLVLWKWGSRRPHRVRAYDPSGKLPANQLSWPKSR